MPSLRVVGFGFRAEAQVDSLASALAAAGGGDVTCFACPATKADAASIRALASRRATPLIAVAADAMRAHETLTRSAQSLAAHGVGSVAEACALAAARALGLADARLTGPRAISQDRMATAAIVEGEHV